MILLSLLLLRLTCSLGSLSSRIHVSPPSNFNIWTHRNLPQPWPLISPTFSWLGSRWPTNFLYNVVKRDGSEPRHVTRPQRTRHSRGWCRWLWDCLVVSLVPSRTYLGSSPSGSYTPGRTDASNCDSTWPPTCRPAPRVIQINENCKRQQRVTSEIFSGIES